MHIDDQTSHFKGSVRDTEVTLCKKSREQPRVRSEQYRRHHDRNDRFLQVFIIGDEVNLNKQPLFLLSSKYFCCRGLKIVFSNKQGPQKVVGAISKTLRIIHNVFDNTVSIYLETITTSSSRYRD